MDGYPAGCLDHNVPFLVVSGLSSKAPELQPQAQPEGQGLLLRSDYPPVDEEAAEFLEKHFTQLDAHGTSWTGVSRQEPYRFRIKTVGRTLSLPLRRARLPESVEPPPSSPVLHSPFSPLSSGSALYPDGLVDAQWIRKHQELIPAIYACFYTLGNDNRLKADINDTKGALARSGYKTRVAVILLGEAGGSSTPPGGIQERLESIRRGTALDPKSIFYIPAQDSPAELKRSVDNILSVLYSTAVEYYRDLGRHARKKRSRGIAPQPTVPPTTGTSRTLSLPDWNFRYDFKAAVFAEFRQEMDPAIRSFEQAYEILLGQDVLDIIPSWSPRWNEARLLSDVISIRCLRIQFWMGHTTLAVRRWQSHRDRIGDFVDRRGRGTDNYGWQAWEARWAMVMAHLIEKVEVPGLGPLATTLFLQPEKAVLGERLKPWELLHHTGYWYRMAARHTAARRRLARMIPEEDRGAPDSSPASLVASKAHMYDTYMCPAPYREVPIASQGVNHAQLIIDCLIAARTQFQARKQFRLAAEVSLECAREMTLVSAWEDVVAVLRPLWDDMSFRSEGWVDASEDLSWLLRKAAVETGSADLVVAIDWGLMHRKYTRRRHWHYDLSKSLEGVSASSKPVVGLSTDSASSFVSASFVFRNKEGKAGEKSTAQVSIFSEALASSEPVTFSSLRVEFTGSLKPIIIEHGVSKTSADPSGSNMCIDTLTLDEEFSEASEDELPSQLRGRSDLTLKPGQRRVLEVAVPLREAGNAEASSVTLFYESEAYDMSYTLGFRETDAVVGWYSAGSGAPRKPRSNARVLHVQPRPPKMQISIPGQLLQYYTDEVVELNVDLHNDEDEPAGVKLDVHLSGEYHPSFQVLVEGEERNAECGQEESWITGIPLGVIKNGSSRGLVVRIDAVDAPCLHDVQLRASYHLESDAATPITQALPVQLSIVTPFEANYDLVPRVHPEPWPSLFDDAGLEDSREEDPASVAARGLAQQWCLVCHYASFALEDLCVLEMDTVVSPPVGSARCHIIGRPQVPEDGIVAAPRTMAEAQFHLVAQKLSLDDRHPVAIDAALLIKWRRKKTGADSPVNTTRLPVGQYLVLGAEPRVLASVVYETRETWPSLMYLDITIENSSHHFLTFGLTMEPSDTFAFSGAKQTTIHLLPLSRRATRYRLLPLVRGAFLRPGLVVRDKYFQKTLRIIPTEGMKIDKDGLLVWVPGDESAMSDDEAPATEEQSDG
ncbi:gryzun, putative trafficking through golgi domain-containing protein [Hirsutella rhossiliensis]|uniref:Gryzun, putative trafficking through golgi domain-containing protein n=1 Tax=Hirsutella rhossiliensis TaxID=111463 RepID=A0A9P8SEA7_9HYPO|nr:gryzun, putative trafficking through golgi domain-containing protein [Hirsutella rhossiliensis]KAH0958774.1 gryzun, putative trafficking through golgi domain-containing protein [Hirsutella rhossiliensis]